MLVTRKHNLHGSRTPRIGGRHTYFKLDLQFSQSVLFNHGCECGTGRKSRMLTTIGPIVEAKGIFSPSGTNSTRNGTTIQTETNISAIQALLIFIHPNLAAVTPAKPHGMASVRTVPVEQNVAGIIVTELRTSHAIDGLHVNVAFRSVFR